MGPLILPTRGVVYLDAQIIIYSVERHPVYWPTLEPLWAMAARGFPKLITSDLSILECLVGPQRDQDMALAGEFDRAFASPRSLSLLPIDHRTLRRAAVLRAKYQWMKSPDSIHVATAIEAAADVLLTNDAALARVADIPTVLASRFLQP